MAAGTLNWISVPAPCSLQTSSRPPNLLARSRIPGKAQCPAPGALIGNFRSDSDSVVSHVELELRISVSDFRFNLLCPCVAKSVSQRLAPNPVDFIAQHGIQFSLFPFHQQAHARNQLFPV